MSSPHGDLRLLSTLHWVLAGLAGIFSLLPLLYVVMGVMMTRGGVGNRNPPPLFFGWFMVVLGLTSMVLGVGYAVAVAVAGRFIAQARHWTFIIMVAALSCAFFPFGTVLGVFTIVILSRSEVKALFHPLPTAAVAQPIPL